MAIQFSNLASTTLASGVSSSATSVSVTSASLFPTLGGGDYFYATLGAGTGSEIVKVTAISGTTFTVIRGQDGTTAVSHSAGVDCALRVTAAALEDLRDATDNDTTYSVQDGELSENNFTNADHSKLDGIATNANNYTHPSNHAISVITGLQTALDGKVDDSQVLTNVPSGAVFTDTDTNTTYSAGTGVSLSGTTFSLTDTNSKLNLSGGTLTGNLTLQYAYPRINLTDTNHDSDYSIINNDGAFSIYDVTNNSHRLSIASSGNATFSGSVTADGLTLSSVGTAVTTPYNTVLWRDSSYSVDLIDQGWSATLGDYLVFNAGGASPSVNVSHYLGQSYADFGGYVTAPLYKVGTNTVIDASRNITAGNITATGGNSTNWNTAYGWGNHASQSYITNSTASLSAAKITSGVLSSARIPVPANGDWWNDGFVRVQTDGVMEVGKYLDFHTADSGGATDFDLRVTASSGALAVGGTISATGGNSTNWNTAYGWGDHSTESYATETYVGTQISNLVDSSPATLNTLNELAAALGDDANFSTTVTNSIATKLPLAGGTLTGILYLQYNTTSGEALTFKNSTSGGKIQVGFQQNDTDGMHHRAYLKAWKGSATASGNVDLIVRGSGGSLTSDVLSFRSGNASPTWRGQVIWNAGNLTNNSTNWNTAYTYSQVGHLPLAGGTLTGGLTVRDPLIVYGGTSTAASIQLYGGSDTVANDNSSIFSKYSLILNADSTNAIAGRSINLRNGGTDKLVVADTYVNSYVPIQISGTTVIDGSRNITAGTISSGAITATGSGTTNSTNTAVFNRNGGQTSFKVRDDGVVFVSSSYLYVNNNGGFYSDGAIRARGGITNDGGNALSISSGSADITFNSKNLTSVGTISSGAITASGEITANAGIALGDNDKATFGASDDLQIHHNGSNSFVDQVGTGALYLRADTLNITSYTGTENYLGMAVNGAVTLYNNNIAKLSTTSTGIDVNGTISSGAISSSGTLTLSADTTHVINFSASSTTDARGISFNNRVAVSADYNDGYLRLNQNSQFTNGVYTPAGLRVDGVINAYGGYQIIGTTVIDSSRNITAGTISSGAITSTSGVIMSNTGGARVKFSVWNGSTYGIGMQTGYTFGAINNEYVMSFQMNEDSDRGFWWGDAGHANSQGAMALSTDGYLTVASGLRLGFGESDTTHPSAGLQVNGTISSGAITTVGASVFNGSSASDPDSTSRTRYPAANMFTHTTQANGVSIIGGQGGYTGSSLTIGEETGRSSAFKFIKGISDTNGSVGEEFSINGVGDAVFAGSVRAASGNYYGGSGVSVQYRGFGDKSIMTGVSGATYLYAGNSTTVALTLQSGRTVAPILAIGQVNSFVDVIDASRNALFGNNLQIGGSAIGAGNSYNVAGYRLLFGGGNSDSTSNYYIGTNLENVGGNYSKLDLRWHTGIRMGAQGQYGGIRFYNNEDLSSKLMSIGEGSGVTDVKVYNDLNVVSNIEINGTTVIDASRNLTSIGTYSGFGNMTTRAANVVIDAQSSADGQTIGFRAGYLAHATLAGHFRYTTGDAQLYIDNDFVGNNSVYSTINFRNKANGGSSLITRLKIHGSSGNVDVTGSNFQMGGQTVIDSSRNLTNIGTINSGNITAPKYYLGSSSSVYGVGIVNASSARFDTVDSGYSTDPLELVYHNGTGVVIGTGGGNKYLAAGSYQIGTTTVINSAREIQNVTFASALYTDEYGKSLVGNFGQFHAHSAYAAGFNASVDMWGWNFVQGNANAPNTSSNQWYRNRVSLGDAYGYGTSAGDYWCEMAYPRYNQSTAGHMWMRVCENGGVGSWSQVGSSLLQTLKISGSHSSTITTPNINSFGALSAGTAYNYHIMFKQADGTVRGQITNNIYGTQYTTSSDYRLKENVQPLSSSTSRTLALKPCTFEWIDDADNNSIEGFLAHEVAAIVPEAVVGTKDALDADGNPEYQTIDQSKLIPILVKTIQELEARITALESA